MDNTTVISARVNMIDTVVSLLELTDLDLSNQLVVFPGKRPAHFLRKKLSELIGSSYIPPKIFSMDGFISYLNLEIMNGKESVLDSLNASILLFEIHKELKERIGANKFLSFDVFLPLGIKLFSELEELMLADIEVENLKSLVEGIPYGKLNLLWKYYDKFYNIINSRGYTTRALQYSKLSQQIENIDLFKHARIIFAGFFALTPVEKKIFNGIRIYPNSKFVYQCVSGYENSLPINAADNNKDTESINGEQTEIRFIKSPDTHGQVMALNSLLGKNGKVLDEHTVIVLPSENALFPLINEVLSGVPENKYNVALGYPLSRTPIFRFISSLTELTAANEDGKLPAALYLKFILHPYTKNILYKGKSETTRVLIHTIEKFIAKDQSKLRLSLEEIENWKELFDAAALNESLSNELVSGEDLQKHLVSIHDNTVRLISNIESFGDFAKRCKYILTYVYENSTANMHPLFRQYAECMIEVFETIESSLTNDVKFERQHSYVNLLKQYVGVQNVPFPGTPLKGLQVLGLLETRNLQFDNVYIFDVNEGTLPPGRNDDMLLPQSLRKMLGMETYRKREKLVEYYFDLLLNGAKQVNIFFREVGSSEKERSRFVQKLIWRKERVSGRLILDNAVMSVRYRMRLTNDLPTPITKTPEMILFLKQMEFSATKLDSYLRCPLQFYYKYVLRLREKDELAQELDNADVGNIVHAILREIFAPLVGRIMSVEDIDKKRIEDSVNKEFSSRFGKNLIGSQHMMYKQILYQIKKVISEYQTPLVKSEQITIVGLEEEQQAFDNDVILNARPDRIEKRGNKIYVIDYKTSSDNKHYKINWNKFDIKQRQSWNDSIGSLQLPLYLHVYKLFKEEDAANIIPAYLILGNNKISEDIEIPLFENEEEKKDKLPLLIEVLHALINEIRNEVLEFIPTQNYSSVCKYCSYTNLCGTAWIK